MYFIKFMLMSSYVEVSILLEDLLSDSILIF